LHKNTTKTSRGILSKAWYEIDGETQLVKGNTENGLEPFAEYIGSRIAHYMTDGFAVIYDLEKANLFPEIKTFNLDWDSTCPKYKSSYTMQFSKYVDYIEDKEVRDYRVWLMNKGSIRFD
jgi:hypothetical protein